MGGLLSLCSSSESNSMNQESDNGCTYKDLLKV